MSAMAVAMLQIMRLPSGIGGSVATFVTWHRRFGSAINRLRSAVLGVSLVLSLPLRFCADLYGMRIFTYTRFWSDSLVPLKRAGGHYRSESVDGLPTLSEYSANVFVYCCGWRFETCRTRQFWGYKNRVQKSGLVVFYVTQK